MSRLDYLTIAIVGACILAIIFLVYKMTDLFSGDNQNEKIEAVQDSVETEDDDIYDYEVDDNIDSTGDANNSRTDTAAAPRPAAGSSTTTSSTEQSANSAAAEDDAPAEGKTYGGDYTHPGGQFMVIAGAYTYKSSARQEVDRLKKKGYRTAGMEIFDRGKYAVVLVDQFNNMADAERLVKKLQADGTKAYVKMKQSI